MFENSRDILNYSLALSVLVLTFLMAWILVYVVKIFREMERVVRDVTRAVEKFTDMIDFAKDKISNAAAVIPLVIKSSEKIFELIRTLRDKKDRASDNDQSENKNRKRKTEG